MCVLEILKCFLPPNNKVRSQFLDRDIDGISEWWSPSKECQGSSFFLSFFLLRTSLPGACAASSATPFSPSLHSVFLFHLGRHSVVSVCLSVCFQLFWSGSDQILPDHTLRLCQCGTWTRPHGKHWGGCISEPAEQLCFTPPSPGAFPHSSVRGIKQLTSHLWDSCKRCF